VESDRYILLPAVIVCSKTPETRPFTRVAGGGRYKYFSFFLSDVAGRLSATSDVCHLRQNSVTYARPLSATSDLCHLRQNTVTYVRTPTSHLCHIPHTSVSYVTPRYSNKKHHHTTTIGDHYSNSFIGGTSLDGYGGEVRILEARHKDATKSSEVRILEARPAGMTAPRPQVRHQELESRREKKPHHTTTIGDHYSNSFTSGTTLEGYRGEVTILEARTTGMIATRLSSTDYKRVIWASVDKCLHIGCSAEHNSRTSRCSCSN
jgi:hypothetical protein